MDTNIITYLACICFLFIFGRIFIVPIKKILKLIINSILGGLTIFLINLVGGIWGFHIGLNIFTSILTGSMINRNVKENTIKELSEFSKNEIANKLIACNNVCEKFL